MAPHGERRSLIGMIDGAIHRMEASERVISEMRNVKTCAAHGSLQRYQRDIGHAVFVLLECAKAELEEAQTRTNDLREAVVREASHAAFRAAAWILGLPISILALSIAIFKLLPRLPF